MAMTPQRYERVRELFIAACECPPGERSRLLDDACGEDVELRREIQSLLDRDERAGGSSPSHPPTGAPARAIFQAVLHGDLTDPVPQRIGQYRILRRIGVGGMGTVYEAEQDHPRRTVALKVVRAGLATESVLKRFEHEAQVLARLQHPGIAAIYEASTADFGAGPQPYFAMELVRGRPLLQYAADANLSLRQRLQLIAQICDAVQHAHTKGVVHRDLKPDNILVADESAKPVGPGGEAASSSPGQPALPKILDFGVARALDADVYTTSLRTEVGQLIGTLPYMSPEQAAGDPNHIDTRSDVYALGVICYELIAGRLPYDVQQKMVHEAVRVIREEEPTRLSSINRVFRGDVETIVAKALEKDKERRYQSASDLGSDIRRYLADEPIIARPASALYQLRKFARRNRGLVTALAAAILILLLGIAGTSYGLYRAIQQRDRAVEAEELAEERLVDSIAARDEARRAASRSDAAVNFLAEVFASTGPTVADRTQTAEQLLDKAVTNVTANVELPRDVAAVIYHVLGTAFDSIGRFDRGEELLRTALDIRMKLYGAQHVDTISSMSNLATLLHHAGKYNDARAYHEQALTNCQATFGMADPTTLKVVNNYAVFHVKVGDYEAAERLQNDAFSTSKRLLGPDHSRTLQSMQNLAEVLMHKKRYSEAEALLVDAMERRVRVNGLRDPHTLTVINNLGMLRLERYGLESGLSLIAQALEGRREVLGPHHPHTLNSMHSLASAYLHDGQPAQAEPMFRELIELRGGLQGPDHPSVLRDRLNLAGCLLELQDYAAAEREYRLVHERISETQGPNHPLVANALTGLSASLIHQERH